MNQQHDMVVSRSLASEAVSIEEQFAANLHEGAESNPGLLEVIGSRPILLTAPHAVNHPREGQLKLADTFTGTIALQLAHLLDVSALIYARTSSEDPNYDATGPFKDRLTTIVKERDTHFVLDIHGMAGSRPIEIAIGTGLGKTLGEIQGELPQLIATLQAGGFESLAVDDPDLFNAAGANTITSFTWRTLTTPAMQIEIRKDFRQPDKDAERYARLIQTLMSLNERILLLCNTTLS